MLRASTSTPSASISAIRSETLDHRRPGASSGWLITAAASGTIVWAWISTVLTRFPLTTTSRRRPALGAGPVFPRLHPTKASPAKAPAIRSPEIGISFLLKRARSRAVQMNLLRDVIESRRVVNGGCYSALYVRTLLSHRLAGGNQKAVQARQNAGAGAALQYRADANLADHRRRGERPGDPRGALGLGAFLVARPLARRRDDQRAGRNTRREAGIPKSIRLTALSRPGERLLRVADERRQK